MRHGKKVNHLSRQTGHRKSMLANMACSLIEHKRIITTVAKAKALKQFVEPLVTKSKEDTTHNRRIVFAYLRNKYGVTELFREVAAKVGDRPGGYTRIIKMGNRLGDNADMAMIELVDFNELYNGGKKEEKKGRSRRAKSKKSDSPVVSAPAPKVEPIVEAPIVEDAIVEEIVPTPEVEATHEEVATVVEEAPVVEDTVEEVAPVVEETPEVEAIQEEAPIAEVASEEVAPTETETPSDSTETETSEEDKKSKEE